MSNTTVTRARIEAVVRANPGIHTAQLAMVLGLAWNTTMHHVRAMAREERLSVHKIDGKLRIFDRQRGAYKHKMAAAVLQDAQNRRVAAYVLQHPDKNQRDLARALDLSTTAMHRRLARLEDAGLLERLAAGRCTLVRATDELPDAFVEAGLRTPPAPAADVHVVTADGTAPERGPADVDAAKTRRIAPRAPAAKVVLPRSRATAAATAATAGTAATTTSADSAVQEAEAHAEVA